MVFASMCSEKIQRKIEVGLGQKVAFALVLIRGN